MSTPPPRTIGRYEVQRELGRGTMGVVYLARDPVLQRNVALKTISLAFAVSEEERATFEARFLQEARAAAALAHPGIVVIYDMGVDPEAVTLYMALEFLRGKTLESILAAGEPLAWRAALDTVARIAAALAYAHSHGVIHRDIKPANVMILASGEPKVMDFGVAKLEGAELTARGMILGSPSYMSPEQAEGKALDARSDLFSLGSLLYELLTGRKAFAGRDVATILLALAREQPPPPSALIAGLPPGVDAVIARALAKGPEGRYPSGTALAQDLEDVLAGRMPRHCAGPAHDRPRTLASSRGASPDSTLVAPVTAGERTSLGIGRGGGLSLPPGKRVSLAVLSGPSQGKVFVLTRPTALIGRSGGRAGADVEIEDPGTSRGHAVVECRGDRVLVRDLGSTNGTFVEDERIEERELEDRSEFRVGTTRFMLIIADAE